MAICASSLFTADESSYCRMLDDGGILVGDRWFSRDSTEADRARYLASFLRRQDRNRRRSERRKAAATTRKERQAPRRIPTDPESQRAHRMPLERRKCLRRTTLAACPTPSEIRTAWRYRNDSACARVRLGALLMDLECYVDNSLFVIGPLKARKIVGRCGGLKGWIRENCPELEAHYKSLQRIKGIAKRLRQRLDVIDPMPLAALLSDRVTEEDVVSAEVHVQPRARSADPVRFRFVWETSPMMLDADGRVYFLDENYGRINLAVPTSVSRHIPVYRSLLKTFISLNGAEKCANETYVWEAEKRGRERSERRVWREMFGYIGRNPGFLAEAGVGLMREIGRELWESVLTERTLRRMREGEDVGIGGIVTDWLIAYLKMGRFYSWGKSVRF